MMTRPSIVVSMGDPAGIGPEIILKAWSDMAGGPLGFCCIGDVGWMSQTASDLGLPAPAIISAPPESDSVFAQALPCIQTSSPLSQAVTTGTAAPQNADCVKASIFDGVGYCLSGLASALVTAPISKSVMYAAGFNFPGHTEYLSNLTSEHAMNGPRGPVMMLAASGLRVVLTSIHEPILSAVQTMNADKILDTARITHHALRHDFGISHPRLALAGVNPHAGEDGALGMEEIEIINPAAAQLRAEGIDITDAQPPDTLFHAEARAKYDAAICHYHDQGLIPVKTLDFHGGVNITLGLPIIRTSPDHGTAFNIAGQGKARPDSLIAALRQADQIAGNRQ
jgi:4-hydroxythreonine-4-phosphate dehydrogenase